MFSVKSVVSNVPSSNTGEVSPDLMTGSSDLLVAQDCQTQCLSNDDAVTRTRAEGKAIDDFRVALADTADAPEAVFDNAENSEKRTASKPAGFQSDLTAACSFGRSGANHLRDIDNTAIDSTHGLNKRKPASVNKKTHQCSRCGACFNRPAKLEIHIRTHTGERPFHCNNCDQSFTCKTYLVRHQKNCHSGGRLHKCDECHQGFLTKVQLVKHKRFHDITRPYPCGICGHRFMTWDVRQAHMTQHDDQRPHTCGLCNQTFKSRAVLKQHQSVHSNDRNFHCHCGAIYKSDRALAAHKRTRHSERKDAILNDSHGLNEYQLAHDKKNALQCSTCFKIFIKKSNLESHEMTHSGERPFLCDNCGCRFRQKGGLVRHKKSYHGDENLHKCNECHLRFSTDIGLRNHKKFHDPARLYQCKVCNFRFTNKAARRMHINYNHGKERSQACEKCGRAFKTKSLLTQHQAVHNDDRKFHCVSCGARYKRVGSLKKHLNDKHPDLQCKTRSTNTGDAVISQSPLVIDQPSTSATNIDLMPEEDVDNSFNPGVDLDANHTSQYEKVAVNSHEKHGQGMLESLERQTADASAVVSQSPSVMDDLMSEKGFDDIIYRYTCDLLDGNDGLFNESGKPYNDNVLD